MVPLNIQSRYIKRPRIEKLAFSGKKSRNRSLYGGVGDVGTVEGVCGGGVVNNEIWFYSRLRRSDTTVLPAAEYDQ